MDRDKFPPREIELPEPDMTKVPTKKDFENGPQPQAEPGENLYEKHKKLAEDPKTRSQFWAEQAKMVHWDQEPSEDYILEEEEEGLWRWFTDGKMNMCYNCLDRHLETQGDKIALAYDST